MTIESRHSMLILLVIVANIASILVFFWFVQEVGLGLRPVALLQRVFAGGRAAMAVVYTNGFDPTRSALFCDRFAGRDYRVVRRIGPAGTFVAFGTRELIDLAQRNDCTIELIPQVGDFVSEDDPLARVYPPEATIDETMIDAAVAFAPERTMQQDPLFAFRIMVDIAARALPPAVNDPTTAVLAIDQIHRLLFHAGNKDLDNAGHHEAKGTLRLVFPVPHWEDIVNLALTEVRQYGASNPQVARRLRALLEHLIERLPEVRTAVLRRELDLLERGVARSFAEPEDRKRASKGDLQGLGGSSSRIHV
jgi:uncharacterized membrane protein